MSIDEGRPRAPHTRMWRFRHVVTRFVNPIALLVAGRLPGLGIITHRGRRSGRIYRAPVNVFPRDDGYLFVLTYGSEAAWVRNVIAAGECSLRTRGRDVRLVEPQVVIDPTRRLAPPPVRLVGRIIGVSEFLRMRTADALK